MTGQGKGLEQVVYRIDWEESERGWGVRPDGVSLHLTEADAKKYIADYWATGPKSYVPDEYERPVSESPTFQRVTPDIYTSIQNSECGIRYGAGCDEIQTLYRLKRGSR